MINKSSNKNQMLPKWQNFAISDHSVWSPHTREDVRQNLEINKSTFVHLNCVKVQPSKATRFIWHSKILENRQKTWDTIL